KNTSDLLRQSYISPSSGYDRWWINDGEVENRGVELSINGEVISKDELVWTVGGNITANRNKVVNTGFDDYVWNGSSIEMLRSPINALVVGHPYNAYYGYKTAGIIQTLEEGL